MTDGVDAEAQELLEAFNAARPDYAPELRWFGMSIDYDSEEEQFVFEATDYIDDEGLAALRERDRHIRYIEAYEYEGTVRVQIEIPVQSEQ